MVANALSEYRTSSEEVCDDKHGSVLRSPYASSLILYLYEEKEIIASQMKRVCKNYNTMTALARTLEDCGLVDVVMRSSPRVTHIYFLSEKGRRVAEKLKEIESFINSSGNRP